MSVIGRIDSKSLTGGGHETVKEPQLPRTRCYAVTQCAGRISVNTRLHQLHWGDQECGHYTSCICNTGGWPLTAEDGE